MKLVNEGLAEEKCSRTAEVMQEVVAADSAAVAVNLSFSGFDWGLLDIGNAVVDWSGFLGKEAVSAGLVGNISKSV